jgi:drug/metabolite transporter (DMT)-like permease
MISASFLFACMGVCVKLSAASFSASELIWWRGAIAAVLIGGWIGFSRRRIATEHWRLHLLRGASGVAALTMYFHAIAMIPLATAVTLNYTSPLWLAAIVVLVMKQRTSIALVIALILGFVGMVLLMRPSIAQDQWLGAALGLGSGAISSVAYLSVRELGAAGEPEWRTVFYFSLISCLAGLPGFISAGPMTSHTAVELSILFGIGVFGLAAQLCMTTAYKHGNALVTSSLSNATVVFASAFGVLLWGELLDSWAWLGVALIIAGGTAANIAQRRA